MPTTVKCQCGCGTLIPSFGNNGKPRRFVHGHNRKRPAEIVKCMCGCGELIVRDSKHRRTCYITGHMKNPPVRDALGCYIKGSPGPHRLQLDRAQVQQLYKELKSTERVAQALDCSAGAILHFMHREKLELTYANSSRPWPRKPRKPREYKRARKNCTVCGRIVWQRTDVGNAHRPVCSVECREVLRAEWCQSREKTGLTPLLEQIRSSRQYILWREFILERDGEKCQNCNSTKEVCVHHIVPLVEIVRKEHVITMDEARVCEKLWNPTNGITLCKECHRSVAIIQVQRSA